MATLHLLSLLIALTPSGVHNPRSAGGWVSDQAAVIPDEAEQRINLRLGALERDLGVELAVVTVAEVEGTPKEFATALFNLWGVGKQGANNGILVLLVLGRRRLEIETGYGVEAILPDGWLGSMQLETMVPAFKRGAYAEGLEAGLLKVEERLRANGEDARHGTGALSAGVRSEWSVRLLLAGGAALLIGGFIGFIAWGRKRERTCPECKIPMRLLREAEDDEALDAGQRAEETLGAVNYRVHICATCQFSRVVADRKWFSGYSSCPACSYRTLTRTSHTVVQATYDHGGEVRVDEQCGHCDHSASHTHTTPRRHRSSSSSSFSSSSSSSGSSSSSFGGGRSGGGGAGSSW